MIMLCVPGTERVEGESKHDHNSGGESYIELLRHTRQEQCRTRRLAGVFGIGLREGGEGKGSCGTTRRILYSVAYGIIVVSNCFF